MDWAFMKVLLVPTFHWVTFSVELFLEVAESVHRDWCQSCSKAKELSKRDLPRIGCIGIFYQAGEVNQEPNERTAPSH